MISQGDDVIITSQCLLAVTDQPVLHTTVPQPDLLTLRALANQVVGEIEETKDGKVKQTDF